MLLKTWIFNGNAGTCNQKLENTMEILGNSMDMVKCNTKLGNTMAMLENAMEMLGNAIQNLEMQ